MSGYPIRDPWWSRPGWSEFGDWRTGGNTHDGLDLYTRRGTVVWAHRPGRVTRKGFHDAGHGHWIAVMYDDGVEVSYSHMLRASPCQIGARVDRLTRLGQVGDTGNAAGNDWLHGSPVQGVALQHVHVEVRRGGLGNATVNPRTYFDSFQLASPTPPAVRPEPQRPHQSASFEEEDTMNIRAIRYTGRTRSWAIVAPFLRGGYIRTSDEARARRLAAMYVPNWGNGPRDGWHYETGSQAEYNEMLAQARIVHEHYLDTMRSALKA